jgi:hypothetical protein
MSVEERNLKGACVLLVLHHSRYDRSVQPILSQFAGAERLKAFTYSVISPMISFPSRVARIIDDGNFDMLFTQMMEFQKRKRSWGRA